MKGKRNFTDALGTNYANQKNEEGLGFQSLYAFNMGMLAKQGCRLITEPHTLVARMLKAKYLPNENFLDAQLNSCASYCWKSMCTFREVIRRGSRWQIGGGHSIRI